MSKKEAQKVMTEFVRSGIRLDDDRATKWLAENLSKIKGTMRPSAFINSSRTATKQMLTPGRMMFYAYDPKTKDSLPFWDDFPIVIILHPKPNGFLGLNLHYLPPSVRATFLNNLVKFVNDPNWAVYNNYKALIKVTYPIHQETEATDAEVHQALPLRPHREQGRLHPICGVEDGAVLPPRKVPRCHEAGSVAVGEIDTTNGT
jgi:hypothetical protein